MADETAPDAVEAQKKAEKKAALVALNQEIARHASRKDLTAAMRLFDSAFADGTANIHTFCAALNANVRCGQVNGALEIFEKLKAKPNVYVDVISCTTVIKGLCSIGEVDRALALFHQMATFKPRVAPNIRTANTILRGCVNNGLLLPAEIVFNKFKELSIAPDMSTWEYLTTLYCQSLKLENALPLAGRIALEPNSANSLASINVNIARSAAIIRDLKVCRRAIKAAREAIKLDEQTKTEDLQLTELGQDESLAATIAIANTAEDEPTQVAASGGKRPWKTKADDKSRSQSLEVFRVHRRQELQQELEGIERYLTKHDQSSSAEAVVKFAELFDHFAKAFSLPQSDALLSAENKREALLAGILKSLLYRFGLLSVLEKLPVAEGTKTNKGSKTKDSKVKQLEREYQRFKGLGLNELRALFPEGSAAAGLLARFIDFHAQVVDSDGRLNFAQLFTPFDGSAEPQSDSPVKLEVCSGAGEWAAAQAAADPSARWLTCELRHDRVYQSFTKAIFAGLHNLAVLGGDATQLLPHYLKPESVDHIFINHPEPPQQTAGKNVTNSQGSHLLTNDFFRDLATVLKVDGKITLVTDNEWYAKYLLKQFTEFSFPGTLVSVSLAPAANANAKANANANASGESKNKKKRKHEETASAPKAAWKLLEESHGMHLYEGKPGPESGHVTEASSYFDRLWKRENITERYFFVLKKASPDAAASASAAVVAAARASGPKSVLEKPSKKTGFITQIKSQSKKIKFDD